VRISFDADKRAAVLEQRGIDMLDAVKIFAGPTATWLDDRRDYGEARQLTAGFLAGRVVLIAWTQRSGTRRVISMRYYHAKESADSAAASPRRSAMSPDDDLPEITAEMLERAELRIGDRVIRRGRSPSPAPKQAIKLRLDPEVLAYYRSKGPGWQTRINETLRRAAKRKTG
jgi:uncharacterized protein